MSSTKPFRFVANGQFEHRECPHHRPVIAFLDKAQLRTELNVTGTVSCGATARSCVSQRRDYMELNTFHGPIVHLYMRGCARGTPAEDFILSCKINFPVVILNGLGIIRHIGWSCPRNCGYEQTSKQRC